MAVNLKRRALVTALAVGLSTQTVHVSAMGLLEAYEAAQQNDPTYRSAMHDREAGEQYRVLGRSNLLPSLGASYTASKNRADLIAPNFLGQLGLSHPEYFSRNSTIQLRQPFINLDGYFRFKQGIAQSNYSQAQFSARSQDLLLRLVGAYADAKYAEDQLALVTVQRDALAEQRRVNERMFQKGEGTKTDMLETQARYDLAEAQVLESRDNVTTARNNLSAIVGMEVKELDTLSDDFRVKPMEPASFDEWKTLALDRNSEIAAQRYAVEAAWQEVNKNRAGHTPRIDLIGSYSKGKSETLTTLNQDATTRSLGVQVSIPIYSGGSVSAATTQAVANHEKAKSDLDGKTSQVLVDLRKQYDLSLSSAARIDALVKSVNSARELVQATKQSVRGGVRINLDVLNAQQQLYTAQRDLAQARYSYLLSYLRLRFSAGTLNAEDLRAVAGYFTGSSGAAMTDMKTAIKVADKVASTMLAPAAPVGTGPAKAKSQVVVVDARPELQALLDAWTQAWSARDVKAYIDCYANDFRPDNGASHAAWSKERQARLERMANIAVRAEAPDIKVDGDTATMKFHQVYKSDRVADSTDKILILAKQDGRWKIKRESSAQ